MQRREFITLVGGAAAWPIVVRAQQPAVPVIGFLSGARLDDRERGAVRRGLNEAGYIEGHNVAIEYRSAEGQYDRLPALAADLVRRQVAVIIAIGGTVTALTAKAATETIPIVFATAGDPVQLRLVSSLNRPGGNVTGVSFLGAELGPKRLELLHQLTPTAQAVGFLINPLNPNAASETSDVQVAARALGQQIYVQHASNERDIDSAFASFALQRVEALLVGADAVFTSRRKQLVTLAARNAVPAIYALPDFVAAGGLISYGASRVDAFRLVGVNTGKILKGEKPADLPVQQSVKVELVINLKTAKALGLTVPPMLLARADEVIE
jgi:putative tryptophan/tyrosine transport system substrate-binding protein